METRGPKLEWLALFLLLPLMAILGYLEVHLQLSQTGHILAQLGILFFICFLANSWISANERTLRRSQYTHKSSVSSRREDPQPCLHAETEGQKVKQPGLFARLTSILYLIIHRG
jgi:hypothetical protein